MNEAQVVIVTLYAVVMVLVGIFPGKIGGREGFLISERRLHGLSGGFTIAASKIGGGLLVTYSSLVFAFGLHAFWLFIGYIIGYALFYLFARRLQAESRENSYYTMADYFEHRFGRGAGLTVGVLCTVSLFGWILTNLVAGSKLLSTLSGWSPFFTAASMAALMAAYLLIGGFNAVVRTDIIQYISLLVIAVLVVVALQELSALGQPVASTQVSMPIGQIVFFLFLGAVFPMGSAELWQRVYATHRKVDLLRALSIASGSFLVLGGALSFVCLRIQQAQAPDGQVAAELGLPLGVASLLPPAISALWFVAFAAAILSSADTFIFTTAASFVQDVLQRLAFVESRQIVGAIRGTIVSLAIVGVFATLLFEDVPAVTFYFVAVTLTLGAMAFGAWCFPRMPRLAFVVSGILGLCVATIDTIRHSATIRTAMVTLGVTALALAVSLLVSRFIGRSEKSLK